jgi:hypothetical protein
LSGITLAVFDLFVTDRETDMDPNFDSFSDIEIKLPLSKLRMLRINFLPKEFENISIGLLFGILYNQKKSYTVKSF